MPHTALERHASEMVKSDTCPHEGATLNRHGYHSDAGPTKWLTWLTALLYLSDQPAAGRILFPGAGPAAASAAAGSASSFDALCARPPAWRWARPGGRWLWRGQAAALVQLRCRRWSRRRGTATARSRGAATRSGWPTFGSG